MKTTTATDATTSTRACVIRGSQKWVDAVDAKATSLGMTRQAFLKPILEEGVGFKDTWLAERARAPKKAEKKSGFLIDDSAVTAKAEKAPSASATKKGKGKSKATKAPAKQEQAKMPAPKGKASKLTVGAKAKTKAGSAVKILALDEKAGTAEIERLLDGRKGTVQLADLR